jgi:hypothetical protein
MAPLIILPTEIGRHYGCNPNSQNSPKKIACPNFGGHTEILEELGGGQAKRTLDLFSVCDMYTARLAKADYTLEKTGLARRRRSEELDR